LTPTDPLSVAGHGFVFPHRFDFSRVSATGSRY
jgi:hypothetical protein